MIPELLPCGCDNGVFVSISVIAHIPAHHFNAPDAFRKEIEDAAIDELVSDTWERVELRPDHQPEGATVIHNMDCPEHPGGVT